jgi:hypothetical protein
VPALPNVPAVIRSEFIGSSDGSEVWQTRFYSQYPGTAPSPGNLVSFNNALAAAFLAHAVPLMGTQKDLFQVNSTDLSSSTAAQAQIAATHVGTRVGAQLPPAAAAVVSYYIGRRYRGGHPRGYWPFGTATEISASGQWDPTFQVSVASAVQQILIDAYANGIWNASGPIKHVAVSYYSGFTVVIDPVTGRARNVPKLRPVPLVDQVISVTTNPEIGTQRRRGQF